MTDEEYVFRQDVRDKAITARSARKTGNAGKRRMPVQQMTRKEWEKMNGPIFAMKMNEPMRWDEFKELPQHMQKQYMDGIMAKYEIGSTAIGKMLGISQSYAGKILRGLDIPVPVHPRRSEVDRFMNEFCSPKPKTEQASQEIAPAPSADKKNAAIVRASVTYSGVFSPQAIAELLAPFFPAGREATVTVEIEAM